MARKDFKTGLIIYSVWILGLCNAIDNLDEGIGLSVKHGSDGLTHLHVSNLDSQQKLGTISLKLMGNSNSQGHMSGNVNEKLLDIFQSNSKPVSTKIIRKTVVESSKIPLGNDVYRFPSRGGYLNRRFNLLNSGTRGRTRTSNIRNNRIPQRTTSQSQKVPRLLRTRIQNSRTISNVPQRSSNIFVNNKLRTLTNNRQNQRSSKKVISNTRNELYKPLYGAVKSVTSNKTIRYNQNQQNQPSRAHSILTSPQTTNNQYRTMNHFNNNWIKITVHNIHLLRNPNVKIVKVGENIYAKAKTQAEKTQQTNIRNRVQIQPKSISTPTINRKIPPKQSTIISRKVNNPDVIPKLDPVKNVVNKPLLRAEPSKNSTKIVSTNTNRYTSRKVNNPEPILKKPLRNTEPRKISVKKLINPVKSFFIRTPSGKLIKIKTTSKTTHNSQTSKPNETTKTSSYNRRENVGPALPLTSTITSKILEKSKTVFEPAIKPAVSKTNIPTTKTIVAQPNHSVPNLDPRISKTNSRQPNNPTKLNSTRPFIQQARMTNNTTVNQQLPTVSSTTTNAKKITNISQQTIKTNQIPTMSNSVNQINQNTVVEINGSPGLKKTSSNNTNNARNVQTATNNQITSVKLPASTSNTNAIEMDINRRTNKSTTSNSVSNVPTSSSHTVLNTVVDKTSPSSKITTTLNIEAVKMNTNLAKPTNTISFNPAKNLTNKVIIKLVPKDLTVNNNKTKSLLPASPVQTVLSNIPPIDAVPVQTIVTNNVPVNPVVTNNVPVDPVVIKNVPVDPVVTNNVPVDPVVIKNVPVDPVVTNNIPVDPVVSNNVPVDPAVTYNAPVFSASTNNIRVDPAVTKNIPAVTNNVSVDPIATSNVPANPVVTYNFPVDPVIKNVPADPTVTKNAPVDLTIKNNFPMVPAVTNTVPVDLTVTKFFPVDPAVNIPVVTSNIQIEPAVANNVPADPVVTYNFPVDPVVTNTVPVDPVVTNNGPVDPVVAKNVVVDPVLTNTLPVDPVVTNNVPVDIRVTKNMAVDPAVTNNVPVDIRVTKNVAVDPVIAKNVAVNPVLTKNVAVDPLVTKNVAVDIRVTKNVGVDPVVTKNVAVDPVVSKNVAVDPVLTNTVSVDPVVTNNASANLVVTKNVAVDPVLTNNMPVKSVPINNAQVDPIVTNNVQIQVDPAFTNNAQVNQNNAPVEPSVTNNNPIDPVVTNIVPVLSTGQNNVDPILANKVHVVANNVRVDTIVTNNLPVKTVLTNNVPVQHIVTNNVPVNSAKTNNVPVDQIVTNNVPVNSVKSYNVPVVTNKGPVDHIVAKNVPVELVLTQNVPVNHIVAKNVPVDPVLTPNVPVDPVSTPNVPVDPVLTPNVPVDPVSTPNVPVDPVLTPNVPGNHIVAKNVPVDPVLTPTVPVDPVLTPNEPVNHIVAKNVPVVPVLTPNVPVNHIVAKNVPVDPVAISNIRVDPVVTNSGSISPIQSNNIPVKAAVPVGPSMANNSLIETVLPLEITNKTSVSHTDPGAPINHKGTLKITAVKTFPKQPNAIINTGRLQPGGATSNSYMFPTAEVPFIQRQKDQLLALNTVADIVNNTTVNGSMSPPENQQTSVAVQPNVNQPPIATYPIAKDPIDVPRKVQQQPISPSLTTFSNLQPDHATKISMVSNTSTVAYAPHSTSTHTNTAHTTYINKFNTKTNSPLADVFSVGRGQAFNPASLTVKASHSSVSNNHVTNSHSNHSTVFLQQHHNSGSPTVITTNNIEKTKLNVSNQNTSQYLDVLAHTTVNSPTNTSSINSKILDSLLKQGHQLDYILKHTRNVPVWHSYTLNNGSVLTWITIDANSSTSQQELNQKSNQRTTISTGADPRQLPTVVDPASPTGIFYHPTNSQPAAQAIGKPQTLASQVAEQTVFNETGILIDPELVDLKPNTELKVATILDSASVNESTANNTSTTPQLVETPANNENIPTEAGIALVPEVGVVADQGPLITSPSIDPPTPVTKLGSEPIELKDYLTTTNTVTVKTPEQKTNNNRQNVGEVIHNLKNVIQLHPPTKNIKRNYTSDELINLNRNNPTRLLFTTPDPIISTSLPTTVVPDTSKLVTTDQTIPADNTLLHEDPVGRNIHKSISYNEPPLIITLGKANDVPRPTTIQPPTSRAFDSKDLSELRSILESNGIKTAEELNQLLMKKSETESRQKLNSIAEHFTKTDNKCPSDKPCLWCRSSPAWSYVDGISGWCMRNCKTQTCVHSRCKCKCVDADEFSTLLQTIASSDLRGK